MERDRQTKEGEREEDRETERNPRQTDRQAESKKGKDQDEEGRCWCSVGSEKECGVVEEMDV